MRRPVLLLFLSLLVLVPRLVSPVRSSPACAHAETTVRFVVEDLDVSAGGHTMSLSLTLRVSVIVEGFLPPVPPLVFSGFGGDIKITVKPEAGSLTLTYDGMPYNKGFETPIGNAEGTEVQVADVPEGSLFVILYSAVHANITAEGPVSLEPENLTWTSEGTQAVHVGHGPIQENPFSMLAAGAIKLVLTICCALEVVAGARSGDTVVFERERSVGAIEGQPNRVETSAWLIPVVPIAGGILFLAIVAAVVRRRRRAPRAPYPEARRWVRCPRCGYEFPI